MSETLNSARIERMNTTEWALRMFRESVSPESVDVRAVIKRADALIATLIDFAAAETARADRAEELTRGYYNEAATALEQRDEATRRADREAAARQEAEQTIRADRQAINASDIDDMLRRHTPEFALLELRDQLAQAHGTITRLNRRCQVAEAAADLKVEEWDKRSKRAGRAYVFQLGVDSTSAERDRLRAELAALRG